MREPTPPRVRAATALESSRAWMTSRARNALHRPFLIGIVGVTIFLGTLLALALVPRQATRVARALMPRPEERVDTTRIVDAVAAARQQLAVAQTQLEARRAPVYVVPPPPPDTFPAPLVARRDTLRAAGARLRALVERAENAPLPASYRALAESPELRADVRVSALLDTLATLERERETIDAIGGVDPMYVAMTARVTLIGRQLAEIGTERVEGLARELASITPAAPSPAPVVVVDTARAVAARDAAAARLEGATRALSEARARNAALDRRAALARDLENVVAPPIAMLAASLILGLVLGFGIAFFLEVRQPRVADVREAERLTGTRVIYIAPPDAPDPERTRRQADRDAPPTIDTSGDVYRLLYLHLAARGEHVSIVTVTGDEPHVAAVLGANLAALSAYDARSTLLVDADFETAGVTGALGVRPFPGLSEAIAATADWSEVITSPIVGRSASLDVIPLGNAEGLAIDENIAVAVRLHLIRLARRYDMVVLVTTLDHALSGTRSLLPAPDVVLCAREGHTTLAEMVHTVGRLRAVGTRVRAIALWRGDLPHVPSLEETMELTGVHAVPRGLAPSPRAGAGVA